MNSFYNEMFLLVKTPDSTLTSEVEQPERKRTKINFSPRAHLCSDISLLLQRQRFISPAYESGEGVVTSKVLVTSTNLPDDIKAVMIALLPTRRRATPGCHDPAAIA